MFTVLFWKDAIERAIATAAQFLVVFGGADGVGFVNVDPTQILTLAGFGALASILKSLAAAVTSNTDTASFTVDTKELRRGN